MADPAQFRQWLGALPPEERLGVAEQMWRHIEGRKPGWEQLDALMADVNIHDFEDVAPTGGDIGDFMQFMFSLGPNALSWARQGDEHRFDQERTYSTELVEAGLPWWLAGTLGTGLDFLEPGPEALKAFKGIGPLMGLLLNVPRDLQRELAKGVHPSLLDDLGLIRQQAHGTKAAAYEVPRAGAPMGNYGRGHYTTPLDEPSNTVAGQGGPMSNIYNAGDNPLGQHTRLDSAALRNPIVTPASGGTGSAPLRPSQEDIDLLRSWLEYADSIQSANPKPASDGRAARAALAHLDELADQIAALGPDASVSLGEWQSLEVAASQALYGLRLRGIEVPEVNATTMLSRAFGIDGVVAGDEVVSYDPVASIINGLESAIEHLRRLGYTDEQIQAVDPVAWSMFQEGSSWSQPLARASMAPAAPPRYPVTELGEPAVPTREALAQLVDTDERAASDWLRAWGVSDEATEDAIRAVIYADSPDELAQRLGKAYTTIDDPDIAAELLAALDPPGAHTPLITPSSRLYPERDVAGLRPASAEDVERIVEDTIRNLESGDDSWLGSGGGAVRAQAMPSEIAPTSLGPLAGFPEGAVARGVDDWQSAMASARADGDARYDHLRSHFRDNPTSFSGRFEGSATPDELLGLSGGVGEHTRIAAGTNPEDARKIQELTASMRERGYDRSLGQPIFIWVDADGVATIAEGNHRIRAAKEAGLEYVPIEVHYFGGSDGNPDAWRPIALQSYLGLE